MNLGNKNFTNFENVRVRGDAGGPGAFRVRATSAFESTLSVNTTYVDADYAHTLPAMSGGIGVTGTFSFSMATIGAGAFGETSVIVSGIRVEDALVCSLQDTFNTVTTDRGMAALVGARPTNGGIHMTFFNFSGTATIPNTLIAAYTAFR